MGEGKPLKRTQDTAITEAFDNATDEILDDGGGVARDRSLAKMSFSEAALGAGLAVHTSNQLVLSLGRRRKTG